MGRARINQIIHSKIKIVSDILCLLLTILLINIDLYSVIINTVKRFSNINKSLILLIVYMTLIYFFTRLINEVLQIRYIVMT